MVLLRRVVVVTVVLLGALAYPQVSQADDEVYVVVPGDTLIGIAARSGVRLADLLQANELRLDSLILPGQRLQVPSGGAPSAVPSPASTTARTHTVQWGDTLIGIAGRHGVSLQSLLAANSMSVTSLIMPGMRLNVPGGTAAASPSSPSPSSPPATPPAPAGSAASAATYTVRWGDTLSGIAGRHGVSLGSLLAANDMRVTSLIMPGMRLVLPAGATAQSGAPAAGGSAGTGAPAATETGVARVVGYALAQQGKPYRFFTKGPDTFDCSGLTLAAYAQIGVKLVHYSAYQAKQGTAVDFHNEPIRPGDLIFQKRRGSDTINHVGMAITPTTWIHAAGGSTPVVVRPMPSKSTIDTVRRYVGG